MLPSGPRWIFLRYSSSHRVHVNVFPLGNEQQVGHYKECRLVHKIPARGNAFSCASLPVRLTHGMKERVVSLIAMNVQWLAISERVSLRSQVLGLRIQKTTDSPRIKSVVV